MNISIGKDKTKKFTKEASASLKEHVSTFVDRVVEEAERIEANRCKSISQIQITPHTVDRAVEYVIEERVEKVHPHWFPAIICPFLDGLGGLVLSYGIEHYDTHSVLAIVSAIVLAAILIYQLTYHIMNK